MKPEPSSILGRESAFVWLIDPRQLRYVRESVMECSSRTRRPLRPADDAVIVGYTVCTPRATSINGHWTRRCFWLRGYDYPHAGPYEIQPSYPAEGVNPRTLLLNVNGTHPSSSSQRRSAHPTCTRLPKHPTRQTGCVSSVRQNSKIHDNSTWWWQFGTYYTCNFIKYLWGPLFRRVASMALGTGGFKHKHCLEKYLWAKLLKYHRQLKRRAELAEKHTGNQRAPSMAIDTRKESAIAAPPAEPQRRFRATVNLQALAINLTRAYQRDFSADDARHWLAGDDSPFRPTDDRTVFECGVNPRDLLEAGEILHVEEIPPRSRVQPPS
jgi:hypothetical protein